MSMIYHSYYKSTSIHLVKLVDFVTQEEKEGIQIHVILSNMMDDWKWILSEIPIHFQRSESNMEPIAYFENLREMKEGRGIS